MPTLKRLPTAEDGVEALLRMADMFGDEEAFRFFGYLSDATADPVRSIRPLLAQRMVEAEMATNGGNWDNARYDVATRLGYTTRTRTNFYKLAGGEARPGRSSLPPTDQT